MYEWLHRLFASELSPEERELSKIQIFIERLFKIRDRRTTIDKEIKCGILHFVSCSFILAVNPTLLSFHGDRNSVAGATALSAGVSSVLCGLFANLPFVLAPTTSTSLYYSLYLQNRSVSTDNGKVAVFYLGILFAMCGFRVVAKSITNIIPFVIKVGICLGVGLLIALEALTEIGLVRSGKYTVLDIGEFSDEIYIAMFAFVGIGLALHYRIRGAFIIGLLFGSITYWLFGWATGTYEPNITINSIFIHNGDIKASLSDFTWNKLSDNKIWRLIFDLFVIGLILLNGLSHGLGETAQIRRTDDSLPRGKWLYFVCGVGTMLSAVLGSGPIMISPESAPGIKNGARTGLSSVVCGILFLLSTIVSPLFASTPASGTSPVLLMIGMMLFENAKNVNWGNIKEALPVFLMATFIPFTYSIFNGVIFGFGIYFILFVFTEYPVFRKKVRRLWKKLSKAIGSSYQRIPSSRATSISEEIFDSTSNEGINRRHIQGMTHIDNESAGSDDDEANAFLFEDEPSALSFELNEISAVRGDRPQHTHSEQEEISFEDVNQLSQSLMSLIGDRYVSLEGDDGFPFTQNPQTDQIVQV